MRVIDSINVMNIGEIQGGLGTWSSWCFRHLDYDLDCEGILGSSLIQRVGIISKMLCR